METIKYLLKVSPKEIMYLRYTLESYDGAANISTDDPKKALIALHVSPGCEKLIWELLEALMRENAIRPKK